LLLGPLPQLFGSVRLAQSHSAYHIVSQWKREKCDH
jgi:hypothetical protein